MGFYDREYYRERGDAGGISWLSGESAMTKRLMAATVAVFVLQFLAQTDDRFRRGDFVSQWLSLDPRALFERFEAWRLLTYALCHDLDNVFHILMNMLGLWFFGKPFEDRFGGRRLLGFYAGACLLAGIAHVALSAAVGTSNPAIGASGGVIALLVHFAITHPREILVFFFIPMEARMVAWIWVLLDALPVLFSLLGKGSVNSGVAHGAHLGGALFAFLYTRFAGRGGSAGYGRRESWFSTLLRGVKRYWAQRKVKIYAPPPEEVDLDTKVDQILAKIHAQGEASLTPDERRVLAEAAKRYKKR